MWHPDSECFPISICRPQSAVSLFGLMNSLILLDHKNMNNCSFKEKKSVNDRHVHQEWVSLSLLDTFQYILFCTRRGNSTSEKKKNQTFTSAHVQCTSPQRSVEAGLDGGDAVYRQHWVSVWKVKVLSRVWTLHQTENSSQVLIGSKRCYKKKKKHPE